MSTKIEWTDETWNPITGCTLVDEGCRNCYAAELAASRLKNHPSRAGLAKRNAQGVASFTGEVRFNDDWLDQPLRWRKPRMIFVCAHGDLFHPAVPYDWIDRVFAVMALAPRHTFQVLTKRSKRAAKYIGRRDDKNRHPAFTIAALMSSIGRWNTPELHARDFACLPNVWLGTSVSDQASADARIPDLLEARATKRFVSAEPLIGHIDIRRYLTTQRIGVDLARDAGGGSLHRLIPAIDWVIVGGESGRRARVMHPDWARNVRDQCEAAEVAFFFKQWGEYDEWGFRSGKKSAGRLLDGEEWSQMPT